LSPKNSRNDYVNSLARSPGSITTVHPGALFADINKLDGYVEVTDQLIIQALLTSYTLLGTAKADLLQITTSASSYDQPVEFLFRYQSFNLSRCLLRANLG
jgi:hypothetical protein